MNHLRITLFGLILGLLFVSARPAPAGPETIPDGYSVETVDIPDHITLGVGGMAFAPDGDLYITTRYGAVWIYREGSWTKFADGLQHALGVSIPGDGDRIFVAQKPELTELVDTDGDDRAEQYNTVSDDWGYTGDYHEFAFGPVRDSRGNFYVALNLAHLASGEISGVMSRSTKDRGTLVKITPDGEMSTYAYGLRSPASMAMSPDRELVLIDSQGDWIPTSALHIIRPGEFYGHPGSLVQHPRFRGRNLRKEKKSDFKKLWQRPAIWVPYRLAKSPGSPAFDTAEIDFGPFDGQIFMGDQTKSNVLRADLERVHGTYQGVVFNFIDHLQCGITRAVFGPDDQLWVGQSSRGWGSLGSKLYGLQRITYDGESAPYAIKTIEHARGGFRIRFTQPVDPSVATKASSYDIRHWRYKYHAGYGSPPQDTTSSDIRSVELVDDRTVRLTLKKLPVRRVYDIGVEVPAKSGAKLTNHVGYYTLNRKR